MTTSWKLYGTGAVMLVLAFAVLKWPTAREPGLPAGHVERLRPANRDQWTPPLLERKGRDFATFVKLSEKGEIPRLTREQIDDYLQTQARSAGSLLTAFHFSQDKEFLTEALERFPNNPQVLLGALQLADDPAKRLEMLEAFKRADPDNGIGNCLAARALIDLGRNEEAVAELLRSSGKPIEDFTIDSFQNAEEGYLSAGFSPLEAKMTALYHTTKPTLMQIASPVLKKLEEVRRNYESAGNAAGAQSLRDIQSELGHSLQSSGILVDSYVGILYERNAWRDIDSPEATAYMEELDRRKASMSDGANKVSSLLKSAAVPETDWLLYFDRAKLFGEKAANDWLLEKHPEL